MSNPILPYLHNQSSVADLGLSPRARLATDNIIADSWNASRGQSHDVIEKAIAGEPDNSFIDRLWNDPKNKEFVDAFKNNKLCRDCAKGDPAALEAYKTYSVQDYFYLIDWVKFQALRLTTIPQSDLETLDQTVTSVGKSYTYVKDWYNTCITTLKIDPSRFKDERSVAELAYANFLQNNTRTEDWFNLHVIMIACDWGWSELALELYNDPTTKKDTVFYETWIKANIDVTDPKNPKLASSAIALSAFLTANASLWVSSEDANNDIPTLFRTSLRLEVALFNAAYEHLTPQSPK